MIQHNQLLLIMLNHIFSVLIAWIKIKEECKEF
jgi:hypothetical protein